MDNFSKEPAQGGSPNEQGSGMPSNSSGNQMGSEGQGGEKKNSSVMWIIIAIIIVLGIALVGWSFWGAEDKVRVVDPTNRVQFSASNLDPLESGHYEGWAIVGDRKISFGRFNVESDGRLVNLDGEEISEFQLDEEVTGVDAFAISIEPDNDPDPEPSDTIILFGQAKKNQASLGFGQGPGQIPFAGLSGTFILGTPTDASASEAAGVWFVDLSEAPNLLPSLNIPDAPQGWKWEGWAVYEGEYPISTGRFTSPSGSDEFSGHNGVDNPPPPFPGEDLIRNLPFNLSGPLLLDSGESLIVISLEPDIDGVDPTGDGPFQLKPLIGQIPEGAPDHEALPLELGTDTLPEGTASLI